MDTVNPCFRILCITILVGIFSPANHAAIPEPSAWYRADDLALSLGAPVNDWPDRSANHLTLLTRNQGVDISITYDDAVGQLNNLPAVHWPGGSGAGTANDATYLRHDADPALQGTAYTIFAVGYFVELIGAGAVNVLDLSSENRHVEAAILGYWGPLAWHETAVGNYQRTDGKTALPWTGDSGR